MSKDRKLAWITRRVPRMPAFRTTRALVKLSKKDIAERCWAAEYNYEAARECESEAWARIAELVEMLEGKRPVEPELLARLNEHREHVVACRAGSCEHNFAALVRAGLEDANAPKPPRRGVEAVTL